MNTAHGLPAVMCDTFEDVTVGPTQDDICGALTKQRHWGTADGAVG